MRCRCVLIALAASAAPLAAQTAGQFSAGITVSGPLVRDGVLLTTLRPTVAPTIGIAFALPTGTGPYRALVEVHYARATLRVTDTEFGTTDDIGTLATIDAVALGEGPITGALRWQAGGGAIFYRPSDNQGVFLDGPIHRWLLAAGIVWTHPLGPHLRLLVNGRVDSHTFTTAVLQARGYAGSQGVPRFGLHLGLERIR